MSQPTGRDTERNSKLTHKPTRKSADRNPKIMHHLSSKGQLPEKHPSWATEIESQISHLQEDLRRTREQLALTESQKRQVQQKLDDAKNQLSILNAKYEDSEREKVDLAESEDARIQELRRLSQERDRAWQYELEAMQNQRSLDSAALNSAMNEIQRLKMSISKLMKSESFNAEQSKIAHSELLEVKQEMDRMVSTVESLTIQLRDCELAKAKEEAMVHETRHQLEIAKTTAESLLSDREALMESLNSISCELENFRMQEKLLQGTIKCGQPEHDTSISPEMEQLTLALENTEMKYLEECIKNMVLIQSAYEVGEKLRNDSTLLEADLQSALKGKDSAIIDLRGELSDKEAQLQSLSSMNEKLHSEIREQLEKIKSSLSLKLTQSTTEIAELKATIMDNMTEMQSIMKENEMLKSKKKDREEMEVELKRVRAQSEQWKKAAEAAMAVFASGKNESFVEKLINAPFSDNLDDESQKIRNNTVLKRMGELWKKGPK